MHAVTGALHLLLICSHLALCMHIASWPEQILHRSQRLKRHKGILHRSFRQPNQDCITPTVTLIPLPA